MDLKPLAVASCCLLALTTAACEDPMRMVIPKEAEAPALWPNVLAARVRLTEPRQPVTELSHLLARTGSVPGVEQVAVVNALPGTVSHRRTIAIGREGAPHLLPTASLVQVVSPSYFVTMEMTLLRGRLFAEGDRDSSAPVAIVNETYARQGYPGEDPLGRRLSIPASGPRFTIVGIVRGGPSAENMPEVYLSHAQLPFYGSFVDPPSWFLLVRAAGDRASMAAHLQRTLGWEFRTVKEWQEELAPKPGE